MTSGASRTRIGAAILLLAVWLAAGGFAWACPNCSAAQPLEQAGGKVGQASTLASFSEGINLSIYFMIGSIYGVFGFVLFILMRAYRNYRPGMVPGGAFAPGMPGGDPSWQSRKEPDL